jgi:circadian clock protein KaiC
MPEIDSEAGRLKTGVAGLDDVLCGGLPSRRVYLLEGDPGTGKTTLALQFLLQGVRAGERVLYVTLSESKHELLAVARSHGWSLDGIVIHEMSAASPVDRTQEEENTLYVPAEVELGERMRALLAEVRRVEPVRVVLDSCSELRLVAGTPLRFRRQVLALKRDLIDRDCTLLLLENPSSTEGDVLLQSIVHGVIQLQQLAPLYGSERRRLRVMKLREVGFRGGYHDFSITRGGLVVFPRLVAAEHHTPFERGVVSTGVAGLDSLLGGGLDRGTSTLCIGPSGAGKSAFAARFAVAAADRGEQVAMYAFDEGTGTLYARAKALGMNLREHVEAGTISVQQVDPAELAPGAFVHVVRDAVENRNVRMVIIDSLNGYLHAMPQEQFMQLQLHELLSYLRQRGIVTIMVMAQHGLLGGEVSAPIDVSYLADTVVLLRFFESKGRVLKAVSVVKKRSGRHEDTIREFSLGSGGLTMGQPLESFRGVLTGVPTIEDPPQRTGAPPRRGGHEPP